MNNIPQTRLRKLQTLTPGKQAAELKLFKSNNQFLSLIDLASNDYLGLSRHPKIIESVKTSIESQGIGAGGSRFVTGSRPIHKTLEENLGEWLNQSCVLLFPSGFQANIAAVIALADRHTPIIADRFIHYSLLVGIKASGAKLHRFAHNDLVDLEKYLKLCTKTKPEKSPLVITESLFSMEGTSPPIPKMSALCEKYGAKFLVDEAHALGVLGPQGRGLCYGIPTPVTMISGTFGKAFGGGGAFLATNEKLGEHLIQTSGAFRYTTALALPLCNAAYTALHLIKDNPIWSIQLQKRAQTWREKLNKKKWSCPTAIGPIISVIIGTDQDALKYQKKLEEHGLLCVAIRPPTVPEGTARLRIVVRKDIPNGTSNKLLTALNNS